MYPSDLRSTAALLHAIFPKRVDRGCVDALKPPNLLASQIIGWENPSHLLAAADIRLSPQPRPRRAPIKRNRNDLNSPHCEEAHRRTLGDIRRPIPKEVNPHLSRLPHSRRFCRSMHAQTHYEYSILQPHHTLPHYLAKRCL